LKFVRQSANKSAVCGVLGINRSGIYYKKKRKSDSLESEVIEIFKQHNANYGSRRIKAVLSGRGKIISKDRIVRILKRNNLESKHGRRKLARNVYTTKDERYIAENLIRNVVATSPNEICHTDFTEMKCKDGKLFVSGVIDAYDRTVVIKYGEKQNKELVKETIELMPVKPKILHSDRGTQYTSNLIKEYLESAQVKRSMSSPYCSQENAMIETFWKTLKVEIGETKNFTKEELKQILDYQVHYYNTERIHSSINYMTPKEKRNLSFSNVS
jgi:transposase InsO family protein